MMENYLHECQGDVWSSFIAEINTRLLLALGILVCLTALSLIRKQQRSRTVRRLNAAIDAYSQLDHS